MAEEPKNRQEMSSIEVLVHSFLTGRSEADIISFGKAIDTRLESSWNILAGQAAANSQIKYVTGQTTEVLLILKVGAQVQPDTNDWFTLAVSDLFLTNPNRANYRKAKCLVLSNIHTRHLPIPQTLDPYNLDNQVIIDGYPDFYFDASEFALDRGCVVLGAISAHPTSPNIITKDLKKKYYFSDADAAKNLRGLFNSGAPAQRDGYTPGGPDINWDEKIGECFTLYDLTRSGAVRRALGPNKNIPNAAAKDNLKKLVKHFLDPLCKSSSRDDINILSAFRLPGFVAGESASSMHPQGLAVDLFLTGYNPRSSKKIGDSARAAQYYKGLSDRGVVQIDQIIYYHPNKGGHVHIGIKSNTSSPPTRKPPYAIYKYDASEHDWLSAGGYIMTRADGSYSSYADISPGTYLDLIADPDEVTAGA